ncbi:hypothetical protein R1sor_010980 [Riccia sorocarpa]|uniref:Uncharacterized protein n=1 Tax=Riccia sorocarpa TaxID=122646 RepID=A0ABD3I5M9_9MARC
MSFSETDAESKFSVLPENMVFNLGQVRDIFARLREDRIGREDLASVLERVQVQESQKLRMEVTGSAQDAVDVINEDMEEIRYEIEDVKQNQSEVVHDLKISRINFVEVVCSVANMLLLESPL